MQVKIILVIVIIINIIVMIHILVIIHVEINKTRGAQRCKANCTLYSFWLSSLQKHLSKVRGCNVFLSKNSIMNYKCLKNNLHTFVEILENALPRTSLMLF